MPHRSLDPKRRGERETVAEKKISAKAIMIDLKGGLTDGELMQKYGLSFQGLQNIFEKLVEAKLATSAYFEKRAMQAMAPRQKEENVSVCPHCGLSQKVSFKVCPRCDMEVSEWLNTSELTDILAGGFK
jgi:hypothetical protein